MGGIAIGALAKKALSLGTKALGNKTLQTAGMLGFQNYMDRRAQERAFAQNKAWWHERFDKEAMYNSPVQQKARMMEAGLNPALMYSGGQTGGNVSGGSAQGKIAEKYQMAELGIMSAQAKNIEADTIKKGVEADLLRDKETGQETANAIATEKLFQEGLQSKNLSRKIRLELTQQAENLTKTLKEIELLTEKIETQQMITKSTQVNAKYQNQLLKEQKNANWQWEVLKKDMIKNGINPDDGIFGNAAQGVNYFINWGRDWLNM